MPQPSFRTLGPRLAGWLAGLLLVVVGLATNVVSDQLPENWGDWIKAHPIQTGIGFGLLALAAVGFGERAQRRHAQAEPASPVGPTAIQGVGTVYGNITVTHLSSPPIAKLWRLA